MKRKQKNTRLSRLKRTIRRHVKLTFVPHGANQYRPHLTRRYGLAVVLALVVGLQAAYSLPAAGSVLGTKALVSAHKLLADTNAERAKRQLPPLNMSDKLSRAAFMKAKDMFAQQYWAHTAPDGTTPWHWLGMAGYNYASAGENLAKNFRTADAAMTAWMSSPAHRENILGARYSDVGFAVMDGTLEGRPATLIVALYGEPAATPAALGAVAMETPAHQAVGPAARFGVALQSMTPAVFASLLVLLVALAVALTAHVYRRKLPKTRRESWYRHHGAAKAAGMLSLIIIILFLYSGGQI